jgi:hypothetical protein
VYIVELLAEIAQRFCRIVAPEQSVRHIDAEFGFIEQAHVERPIFAAIHKQIGVNVIA